jgi:erythromycin esterase-like protein
MIGCQSFGTQEFQEHRTELTKHLITDKQFNTIALGADWPDVRNLHRYVQGITKSEHEAISCFNKFPWWANRNLANVDFLRWLNEHNKNIKYTVEKIKARPAERVRRVVLLW